MILNEISHTFIRKNYFQDNEFIYLDYTSTKQYSIKAKKTIPQNT